jgi:acrylyl-CoA reductase (NADPH)
MFNALLIERTDERSHASLVRLAPEQLPDRDVLVRIDYSTVNYKDALAISGRAPVVRQFPLVPGIDLAGTVEVSRDPRYPPGSAVLLNGWGVGEQYWGGLAQYARVDGDWLVPLPAALTSAQAMAVGTAGYTAMLCIQALERHGLTPDAGEVLVTGANGGVGSFAITLLARAGYRVVASTGRLDEAAHLQALGAAEVIDRAQLSAPGKPLQKERWAAVVDSVGSHTLANACASVRADGLVAACGLAQGMDFPATVAPFILRGVSLLGINSVTRPLAERVSAWARLAADLDADALAAITRQIPLAEVPAVAEALLAGQVRGRVVVDVNA